MFSQSWQTTIFGVLAWCGFCSPLHAERPVRFNRDVQPILTDRCFACHGLDAETVEAGLRLDLREEAVDNLRVIVPGDPEKSELVQRIFADDESEVMPPTDLHKPLSEAEKHVLRRWIEQGAEYEPHWAYAPMRRPPAYDAVTSLADSLVTARLAEEGVDPAPPAERITLIRRLSFDLTGLPPTTEEVEAFVNDDSVDAYEELVDRLLASSRYGERMAVYWLDLVRYADTVGYHGDQEISQSPYRDYVIDAFNGNMPYDQFVREQLAGDLLPDATIRQQVASGYNRLNQTTEEGGAQAKEYLAIYFADRVRNLSQTFMGATVGCAQCHDHKYDPYTTKDFYALGAFFADLDEVGVYTNIGRPPTIRVPDKATQEKLNALDRQIARLESQVLGKRDQLMTRQHDWEATAIEHGGVPHEVASALQVAHNQRTQQQSAIVTDYYVSTAYELVELQNRVEAIRADRKELYESAPATVVSRSVEPRTIRILPRGNWMDDSGEIVEPAIPEFLGTLETESRATRLDLAEWLCREDNPLTARTIVNRIWSLLFGRGIAASVDDLGGQGAYPSYPDVLDALAIEFIKSGWDVKRLVRSIVLSETYRRSSKPTVEQRTRDPYNDLFARQGRFGIDAEMVRDAALATSGLLVEQLGGPSVRPYQPDGYYAQLNFPPRTYTADEGVAQYRRGLYVHWQRTFLHPMLKAFDAPSREECTAQRSRSNTPLQSLVLLNDPSFVEAARVFAERIMREGGRSRQEKIEWAFRTAVSRTPSEEIADELATLYEKHYRSYRKRTNAARQLIASGNAPVAHDLPPDELAAWTSVARALLNLHEAITRY